MHMSHAELARSPEARAGHLELAALWTRLAAQADGSHDASEAPSA